jgi:predicted amidohydrolase YtcJ
MVDARATSSWSFMPEHCRAMATLAIVNGNVWARPNHTSVLIDGERILAVGNERFSAPRVIDAGGLAILPAFNDAHVHFLMASRSLRELDLFGATTQAEVERRIAAYARSHRGAWILGRGWLYSAFPGGMPDVAALDRLIPDRPAYIESFDAHTGWANSRALAIAGAAPDGVLIEAAMETVTRCIPRPSREQDLESLRDGMRLAASRGIGSVQEAGDGQNQLELWRSLREAGELGLRVRLAFDLTPGMDLDRYGAPQQGDELISTGILKAFADGVVESRTAAMLAPYEGTKETGRPLWPPGELSSAVHTADARGWQVQIHAIGDAAIRQALDAYEGTTPGRRHRVEHIETPDPADLPRFARLGVVASMQPQHADPQLTDVWRKNLGAERSARGWPWRRLLEGGAHLAFGTDWPVAPLEPFASLRMATKHLGLDEAVTAWTSGSAYAEHMEREKGEVREGMLADLTIVDLDRSTVMATVVGGRIVYES